MQAKALYHLQKDTNEDKVNLQKEKIILVKRIWGMIS